MYRSVSRAVRRDDGPPKIQDIAMSCVVRRKALEDVLSSSPKSLRESRLKWVLEFDSFLLLESPAEGGTHVFRFQPALRRIRAQSSTLSGATFLTIRQ
jgi:hypothetical protein